MFGSSQTEYILARRLTKTDKRRLVRLAMPVMLFLSMPARDDGIGVPRSLGNTHECMSRTSSCNMPSKDANFRPIPRTVASSIQFSKHGHRVSEKSVVRTFSSISCSRYSKSCLHIETTFFRTQEICCRNNKCWTPHGRKHDEVHFVDDLQPWK